MNCPYCHHALTDDELRRLWAQRNAAKQTPHAGPGRPKGSKDKAPRKRRAAAEEEATSNAPASEEQR